MRVPRRRIEGALFHASLYFLNRRSPSQRLLILFDYCVSGWKRVRRCRCCRRWTRWLGCVSCGGHRSIGAGGACRCSGVRQHRHVDRLRSTPVTRVATHRPVSAEIPVIDREHHFHHVSGAFFRRLLVTFEMVLDVAVIAANTKSEGNVSHGREKLICRNIAEHLVILICLAGGFYSWRRCLRQ